MEAFMSYKSLYKKLGDQVSSIQNRTLEFEPWPSVDTWPTYRSQSSAKTKATIERGSHASMIAAKNLAAALEAASDISRFEASLAGISQARKFIRKQMVYIVNEVDLITEDPKIATDADHEEPFQSPTLFESRVPVMKIPDALKPKSNPLSGKMIMAKTQNEDDLEREREAQDLVERDSPPLYQMDQDLMTDETQSLSEIQKRVPSIGKHLQVSKAMPKSDRGSLFNNLDVLLPEWEVDSITIGMTKSGSVGSVEVLYENGLLLRKGLPAAQLTTKTLGNFQPGERITSAVIEAGTEVAATADITPEPTVLSVCMYSNRGRRLLGQALRNEILSAGRVRKDGTEYKDVQTLYLDSAYSTGSFKGFFGRLSLNETTGGICRLGLIWGDSATTKLSTTAASPAPVYDIDAAASEGLIDSMKTERDQARKEAQALTTAKEERDEALRLTIQAREEANKQMDQLRADAKTMLEKVTKSPWMANTRQSVTYTVQDFPAQAPDHFLTFNNGVSFSYLPQDGQIDIWFGSQKHLTCNWRFADLGRRSMMFSSKPPYMERLEENGQRSWGTS